MKYKDIREAFEYGKSNPNSTIEDFLDSRSKNITSDDKEVFADVEFTNLRFNIQDKVFDLILLKSDNSTILSNFEDKLIGVKEYYDFYAGTTPYGEFYSLISLSDYELNPDEWDNFEDYEGVKHLINSEQETEIMFDGMDADKNESKFYKFCKIKEQKERCELFFWDENRVEIFINNLDKLKFDKALNLIKNGI